LASFLKGDNCRIKVIILGLNYFLFFKFTFNYRQSNVTKGSFEQIKRFVFSEELLQNCKILSILEL
jgi:hypothetical protein